MLTDFQVILVSIGGAILITTLIGPWIIKKLEGTQ